MTEAAQKLMAEFVNANAQHLLNTHSTLSDLRVLIEQVEMAKEIEMTSKLYESKIKRNVTA